MSKKSPLAPLSPLFNGLNWIALLGWTFVLWKIVIANISSSGSDDESTTSMTAVLQSLDGAVLGLEVICAVEIFRIILGDLKGNLVLGVVLHCIRFATIIFVMPKLPGHWTKLYILTTWAVTEVSRYPMYVIPNVDIIRNIRMVVPLFTFPVGAFSEASAAYLVLTEKNLRDEEVLPWWLSLTLIAVLFINGVLGTTMAYPALLKKGLPVLLGKKDKEKTPKVKRV